MKEFKESAEIPAISFPKELDQIRKLAQRKDKGEEALQLIEGLRGQKYDTYTPILFVKLNFIEAIIKYTQQQSEVNLNAIITAVKNGEAMDQDTWEECLDFLSALNKTELLKQLTQKYHKTFLNKAEALCLENKFSEAKIVINKLQLQTPGLLEIVQFEEEIKRKMLAKILAREKAISKQELDIHTKSISGLSVNLIALLNLSFDETLQNNQLEESSEKSIKAIGDRIDKIISFSPKSTQTKKELLDTQCLQILNAKHSRETAAKELIFLATNFIKNEMIPEITLCISKAIELNADKERIYSTLLSLESICRFKPQPEQFILKILMWLMEYSNPKKLLALQRKLAKCHYQLGILAYQNNKYIEAIGHWRQTQQLDPNNVFASKYISETINGDYELSLEAENLSLRPSHHLFQETKPQRFSIINLTTSFTKALRLSSETKNIQTLKEKEEKQEESKSGKSLSRQKSRSF